MEHVQVITWRNATTHIDGTPAHFIGDTPVAAWGSTGDGTAEVQPTRFARGTDGSYFRFHAGPGAWERLEAMPA